MRTIRKKKNILAASDIVRMLPDLPGQTDVEKDHGATDLLRTGSLFEIPVRSPFLAGSRFRVLPFFIKRWIRALYGLSVFFHEKFDANRKTAYFMLLEQLWKDRSNRQVRLRKGSRRSE